MTNSVMLPSTVWVAVQAQAVLEALEVLRALILILKIFSEIFSEAVHPTEEGQATDL